MSMTVSGKTLVLAAGSVRRNALSFLGRQSH